MIGVGVKATRCVLPKLLQHQCQSSQFVTRLVRSFVFGSFDFDRIIAAEGDPSVFGFSLEFAEGTAGLRDNYWSLEGLYDAGNEAMRLCREHER
jgi:hypothetical protein